MRKLWIPLLVLTGACVPDEVHQQQMAADQARISELLARVAELQNQTASVMATQRTLEVVCWVNGLLLAVCLLVLSVRARRKGGPCT